MRTTFRLIVLALAPDGEVLEDVAYVWHIAIHRQLKEGSHHAQGGRLAKTPRSAEERNATPVDEFAHNERLVNVDKAPGDVGKALDANGKLLSTRAIKDVRRTLYLR